MSVSAINLQMMALFSVGAKMLQGTNVTGDAGADAVPPAIATAIIGSTWQHIKVGPRAARQSCK